MSTQYFPPGCTRYSGLTPFRGTPPMAYDQVKAIRREATPSRGGIEGFMAWAEDHYTWARYTREVNHLPKPMAKALLSLLLMRDIGKDYELGLLGNTPTPPGGCRSPARDQAAGLSGRLAAPGSLAGISSTP